MVDSPELRQARAFEDIAKAMRALNDNIAEIGRDFKGALELLEVKRNPNVHGSPCGGPKYCPVCREALEIIQPMKEKGE